MKYIDTYTQKELLKEIKAKGLLIGSRSWGLESDASDWDFVLSRRDYRSIKKRLNNTYINHSAFIDTISVHLCGETIQMWPETKKNLDTLAVVNNALKHICIDPVLRENLRNKEKRVSVFSALCMACGLEVFQSLRDSGYFDRLD